MTYDRVLLDLDGTVYLGHGAVPGAAEAITALRERGIRLAFVTNDPGLVPQRLLRAARAIGIAVATDELVTCAWATAQLVAEEQPGRAGARARLARVGLPSTSGPASTLVDDYREADVLSLGGDSSFGYRELETPSARSSPARPSTARTATRTFPTADGPSPGAGALIAAVEYATGRAPGAQASRRPACSTRRSGCWARAAYLMVGDRLDADVAGAAAAGLDAALVLTGRPASRNAAAWEGRSRWSCSARSPSCPPTCSGR